MGHVDQGNAQRPDGGEYSKVIQQIADGGFCPFCPEHLADTHPNPIVAENDGWLATDNAYPYKNSDQHMLFIHKAHIEDIDELTPEGWTQLRELVSEVRTERKIKGAALVLRFGKTALTGASVSHLHAQLVNGTGDPEADPVLMRVG